MRPCADASVKVSGHGHPDTVEWLSWEKKWEEQLRNQVSRNDDRYEGAPSLGAMRPGRDELPEIDTVDVFGEHLWDRDINLRRRITFREHHEQDFGMSTTQQDQAFGGDDASESLSSGIYSSENNAIGSHTSERNTNPEAELTSEDPSEGSAEHESEASHVSSEHDDIASNSEVWGSDTDPRMEHMRDGPSRYKIVRDRVEERRDHTRSDSAGMIHERSFTRARRHERQIPSESTSIVSQESLDSLDRLGSPTPSESASVAAEKRAHRLRKHTSRSPRDNAGMVYGTTLNRARRHKSPTPSDGESDSASMSSEEEQGRARHRRLQGIKTFGRKLFRRTRD